MEIGQPVAVPWYEDEKSYLEVMAMPPASERQNPLGYDAFLVYIKNIEQKFKSDGGITRRMPINAVALKRWCDANNLNVCRKSVREYITLGLAIDLRSSGKN